MINNTGPYVVIKLQEFSLANSKLLMMGLKCRHNGGQWRVLSLTGHLQLLQSLSHRMGEDSPSDLVVTTQV